MPPRRRGSGSSLDIRKESAVGGSSGQILRGVGRRYVVERLPTLTQRDPDESAMLHRALYDAVVAGDGGTPSLPGPILKSSASAPAAAAQAAHDVLAALSPSQQASLDTQLNAALARIPAGARRSRGIKAGQAA